MMSVSITAQRKTPELQTLGSFYSVFVRGQGDRFLDSVLSRGTCPLGLSQKRNRKTPESAALGSFAVP